MKYFSQSFSRLFVNILLIALTAGAALGQYPATGNKQRLGFQTTGDGLIYRGRLSDTTAIKPSNINNAFYLQDTINDKLYRYIKTNGGWQPVQGKVQSQNISVGADGANGATLYLTGSDTQGAGDALVVVDGLSSLRLPGVNNTVVGIVTVTTVQNGVTITGTGLAVISETPGENGEITVNVVIPSGYITSAMLGAGLVDSVTTISVTDATTQDTSYVIVNTLEALQLPWDGSAVLGYSSAGESIENAVYLNVNGKNILIQGGGAMSMTANDAGDILTITSATNVAISQATGAGAAYSIVDAISSLRLPWDGNAVLGVVETFTSNDVTLTINDTTVTFKVGVTDGDKGDITVSGENWQIDAGAVSWTELSQGVKDSINQKLENPVDSILFTTGNENTAIQGELTYNNQSGTLHLGMTGGIEMPVGQGEAHLVRNTTGTTIAKGKVVYIVGATGQRPRVALADADAEMSSSVTFGITAEEIAHNDTGFVFTSGYIHGINTNSLNEGEALWLSTTAGEFTHDKPTAPVHSVLVGYVITKKNNGTIFVKVQNGYELGELHDVSTQGRVTNDILRFTGSIWQPGKDTSVYNMNGTLKGNRTILTNNFQLLLRDSATAVDMVEMRSTYAGVKNTTTGNFTTVDQYGIFHQNSIDNNNAEIYLSGGQIAMSGNTSTDNVGLDPDLVIDQAGRVKFRVSAGGTVDSLYGKNSSGQLTATVNNLGGKLNASDTVKYVKFADTLTTIATKANVALKLNAADTASLSNRIDDKISGSGIVGVIPKFNTSTELTNSLINDTGLGVGIGVAPIIHYLGFNGSSAKSIGMERSNTPGNGNNLTLQAGAPTSGESNRNGGNLILSTGVSTGNGSANIEFKTATAGASGSADRTPDTKMTILGNGNVGIKTASPARDLHVAGELRVTDLTTDTPTRIVGADADGDFGIFPVNDTISADERKVDLSTGTDSTIFARTLNLFIWALVDSADTDTLNLPTPSAAYAGKTIELLIQYEQTAVSYLITGPTDSITSYANIVGGFAGSFSANDLSYAKIVCMRYPRSSAYKWVITHIQYNAP